MGLEFRFTLVGRSVQGNHVAAAVQGSQDCNLHRFAYVDRAVDFMHHHWPFFLTFIINCVLHAILQNNQLVKSNKSTFCECHGRDELDRWKSFKYTGRTRKCDEYFGAISEQ